jgi:hypothetical protein
MVKRKRSLGLAALAGLMLLATAGAAWAACGTCQTCKRNYVVFGTLADFYCIVANDQDGYLCCNEQPLGNETYCAFSGDACYGIIVDDGGGGSGGGGGGGGACSYQSGWCPPECMSCSGFGRPAI